MKPPLNLTCEYAANPINVDTRRPRLIWLLQPNGRNRPQSAYQILVTGSRETLLAVHSDIWDRGKAASNNPVNAAHLMLHIPNAMILETVRAYYDGWYNEVVSERIPISDGMLSLPQRPGPGVALREEVLHWPDARVEVGSERD